MEQSIQEKNFWDILSDKLVERILHCAVETSTCSVSDHKCQTYRSILQTFSKFKMVNLVENAFFQDFTYTQLTRVENL